jgi:3-hydroxyacyl-[acyl-carrier-protein] dehydratase
MQLAEQVSIVSRHACDSTAVFLQFSDSPLRALFGAPGVFSSVEPEPFMRFLLIDRITELTPNTSIAAVKNLTLGEEYLADHFPGFPVMPGVLMLEALVQAGAWLMRVSMDFSHSTILLRETKAVRYNNFVSPGKSLMLQVTVKKHQGNVWDFQGAGTVDGNSAVSARFTLEGFNLADRNPAMASADELGRQAFRELLPQVWAGAKV